MWNDVLATESLVGEFSSHLYYGSSSDGGRSQGWLLLESVVTKLTRLPSGHQWWKMESVRVAILKIIW